MVCVRPQLLRNHWKDCSWSYLPPFWFDNFTGVMGLYHFHAHYNIGTLCGRNSSETTVRILLKFCRIICHLMWLTISYCHFDWTVFTVVVGLYRLRVLDNIGMFFVDATPLTPLNRFCWNFVYNVIVCHHMYNVVDHILPFDSTNFYGSYGTLLT